MRTLLLIFLLPGFLLLGSCTSSSTEQAKPNIIYIVADDLGYGDLGVYGQEIIQTPHIDALAESGMIFTQHYAGNTVCAPSRCALMTGFHMGHAEIRGNSQVEPYGQRPLSEEAVTVAALLKQAGYTTGMIGKWGLGVEVNSGFPLNQGFDFFYGYLDQVLAHNYYPEYLWRNGEKEYLDNEVLYLDPQAWHAGLGSYSTKKNTYSHDLKPIYRILTFGRDPNYIPVFIHSAEITTSTGDVTREPGSYDLFFKRPKCQAKVFKVLWIVPYC
mgnify:CR=1 FL=1